jgi:hypothetical protein
VKKREQSCTLEMNDLEPVIHQVVQFQREVVKEVQVEVERRWYEPSKRYVLYS